MLFTLFLAKWLAPEAFGLIAMVAVVFELANAFVQSGLGQALIRSPQVSRADLSTVFFTNLALSTLAYASVFFSAPYIAQFYKQPELTLLVQVMGIVVFMNAANVVQRATLARAMNFKVAMQANTVSLLISGIVAIIAAYYGAGVWSLVWQLLLSSAISAAIIWFASDWRPELSFSLQSLKRLYSFGINVLAEGMLSVLYQNSYVLVIGRFFSAEITGLYYFAKKISHSISQQLTAAVQQATYPALATLQNNNTLLCYKYRQIIQLMIFMIAPVMLLLATLAPTLFMLLFSQRWQAATPYMQLLCIVGTLYPLNSLNINIMNVKGRSDLVLKVGLVKKAINLILLFLAVPHGILMIIYSQIAGSFLALFLNSYYSVTLIGYSIKQQLIDVAKPVSCACLAALSTWLLILNLTLSPFFILAMAIPFGVTIYLASSFIVKAEGLQMLIQKAKQYLGKV